MKILAVGDLHGDYKAAEAAINKICRENYDKLIFIGDYVDSSKFSIKDQLKTIEVVNEGTRHLPNYIEALIGNHDHPNYIFNVNCTNKQVEHADKIIEAFSEGIYKVAWEYGDYLFTHAGVTNKWEKKRRKALQEIAKTSKETTLAGLLNAMYLDPYFVYDLFDISDKRGGKEKNGGPIWADSTELYSDGLRDYNQVVGHTKVANVKRSLYNGDTIFFINCLHKRGESTYDSCFLTLDLPDYA